MPEGHKTHFLAAEHRGLLAGQSLRVTSPQGRFRGDARKVSGKTLDSVDAVGKHLFYRFDSDQVIHIHLGRYGKFRQHGCPPPKPIGQVRMRLLGPHDAIDLTGPTTCRVIDADQAQQVVAKLGPDPLLGGRKSDVWKRVCVSDKPIGAILLDQSVVAGVGNIFRAEVLFEVEIDPLTPGSQLSDAAFDRLWTSLSKMMKRGLKYGRIISVTSREAGKPLAQLNGNERFRVYGQSDCPRCGRAVQTTELASRKLYYCGGCQVLS